MQHSDQQIFQLQKIQQWALMAVILVMATAYRWHGIDRLSLWSDELWGVMACSQDTLMAMIRELITRDNHPPGYQTILYYVMKVFGNSDAMVRAPSAVAGVLAVFAVYHVGKKLFSVEAGIFSALVLAGSYQHIVYSQEARAYTMLALMTLLNTYYFLKLFVFENTSNKNISLFALSGALCVYLHYAGILFVVCEAFVGCILWSRSKNKKGLIVAALYGFGIIGILYFRWIPVMIAHMQVDQFYWAKEPTLSSLTETIVFLLGPDKLRVFWQLLALLGAVFFIAKSNRRNTQKITDEQKALAVLAALIVLPVGLVFVKSVSSDSIYTQRYFVFAIPLACLLVGYAVDSIIKRGVAVGLQNKVFLGALVAITMSQAIANQSAYSETFAKQDFRGAIEYVAKETQALNQQYMIIASHEYFDFYLQKYGVQKKADHYLLFPNETADAVRVIDAIDPVIIFYLGVSGKEEKAVAANLAEQYKAMDITDFNGITIRKYVRIRESSSRQLSTINRSNTLAGSG